MAATDVAPIVTEPDPVAERDHQRDFSELADRWSAEATRRSRLCRRGPPLRGRAALVGVRHRRNAIRTIPRRGRARTLREKMEDAALVHRLTAGAPRISLHIPWDEPRDLDES